MKYYVALKGGLVGYISDICACDECQARGEIEIFVNDLYGNYLDCIKHHEFFDSNIVLNIGNSIEELSQSHSVEQIARFIADVYHDELLKKSDSA